MSMLFKVCLDIEGNDRGLVVTTVAAGDPSEAVKRAINHVGVTNQNYRERRIDVVGVREVGANGCLVDQYIPREWAKR